MPRLRLPARAIAALPRAAALPLLFHRDGGFWHRDPASGVDTPLSRRQACWIAWPASTGA
jgi:hypothetical protein